MFRGPVRSVSWIRFLSILALVGLLSVVMGCSKPTGSITGKVTFKDAPVKGGSITFSSTEGLPQASGVILEDGTYSIPSITAGSYKVLINTEQYNPNKGGSGFDKGRKQQPGNPKANEKEDIPGKTIPGGASSNPADMAAAKSGERYVKIPEKYNKAETTDLTYTVVSGAQTKDFELKESK
jgi:hypothetical protein